MVVQCDFGHLFIFENYICAQFMIEILKSSKHNDVVLEWSGAISLMKTYNGMFNMFLDHFCII